MKRKFFVWLLIFAMVAAMLPAGVFVETAYAAAAPSGFPEESEFWRYVNDSDAEDGRTWVWGNAYGKHPEWMGNQVNTDSAEYKEKYEKLQADEFLKNAKICILYLPNCPYSKTYLPIYKRMAESTGASVLLVDALKYQTGSLLPYYMVTTQGITSPAVLYVKTDGTNGGQSAVHSAEEFAEILREAGFEPAEVPEDSNAYNTAQEYRDDVLRETNRQRLAQGLLPLSTYKAFQDVADLRAEEAMVKTSHTRPNGTSYLTAISEANLKGPDLFGENICAGPIVSTPLAAMDAWMHSTPHRANILRDSFTHIGIGYYKNTESNYYYKDHWVQLFSGTCKIDELMMDPVVTPSGDGYYTVAQGTSITDMNLTLTLKCSTHGETTIPLIDEMCTGYDKDVSGAQYVTVSYGELTTHFYVNVGENQEKIQLTDSMVTWAADENGAAVEPEFFYNGLPKTPAVAVSSADGSYPLLEGFSYDVTYSNNVEAGTGEVIVTGKGNCVGTVIKTFEIQPAPPAGITDEPVVTEKTDTAYTERTFVVEGLEDSYTYTGKEITPAVVVKEINTVKDSKTDEVLKSVEKRLYEGKDYDVTYADNIGQVTDNIGKINSASGEASVTVTGKGDYTGSVVRSFKIASDEMFRQASRVVYYMEYRNARDPSKSYDSYYDMLKDYQQTYPKETFEGTLLKNLNSVLYTDSDSIEKELDKLGKTISNLLTYDTYPEAQQRLKDYYRFLDEYYQAPPVDASQVTTEAVSADSVSVQGLGQALETAGKDVEVKLVMEDFPGQIPVDASSYDSVLAVSLDIEIQVDGEAAKLETPVVITMEIPDGLEEARNLVVLHYENGIDGEPEELSTTINGDGTFSFAAASFSPFVITNKIDVYDVAQDENGTDGMPSGVDFGSQEEKTIAPPANVTAVRSGGKTVKVAWEAPKLAEGWTVTGYQVACSVNENMSQAAAKTLSADTFETELTDLESGTYYITVTVNGEYNQKPEDSAYAEVYTGSRTSVVARVNVPETVAYYPVTVQASEGGKITGAPVKEKAGETVTFTVTPSEDHKIGAVKVTDSQAGAVEVSEEGGRYSFRMPACSVAISATFQATGQTAYQITAAEAENGTIAVAGGQTTAKEGDIVNFTVTPANGYRISAVTVNGESLTGTGGTYSFIMPGEDVTIRAVLVPIETTTPTPTPEPTPTITPDPTPTTTPEPTPTTTPEPTPTTTPEPTPTTTPTPDPTPTTTPEPTPTPDPTPTTTPNPTPTTTPEPTPTTTPDPTPTTTPDPTPTTTPEPTPTTTPDPTPTTTPDPTPTTTPDPTPTTTPDPTPTATPEPPVSVTVTAPESGEVQVDQKSVADYAGDFLKTNYAEQLAGLTGDYEIRADIKIEPVTADQAADAEKEAIGQALQSVAEEGRIAQYYKIGVSVSVVSEGSAVEGLMDIPATEAGPAVALRVRIPDEAKDAGTIFMVRCHEGSADILDTTVKNGYVSFVSDRFSLYAMAYAGAAEAVPTPAPETTPAPTPEDTPVPTPENTPTPTPKPEDTAAPTPTPEDPAAPAPTETPAAPTADPTAAPSREPNATQKPADTLGTTPVTSTSKPQQSETVNTQDASDPSWFLALAIAAAGTLLVLGGMKRKPAGRK